MDDTKKMLRAIINGQSTMKSELLKEISKHRQETEKGFNEVNRRLDKHEIRLNKIGKSLAYLEDDAPTREEHDNLEKRVRKPEQKLASV